MAKIAKQQSKTKNTAVAKFFISTGLTIATYIGLTKAKHKYTENKIRKNILKEEQAKRNDNTQNPSFKGLGKTIQGFAFSPVKNMWILDGAITGERLADSRSPQEFIGYFIKEMSTLCFMYYAGGKIQDALEKYAHSKYNKSIGLDVPRFWKNILKI